MCPVQLCNYHHSGSSEDDEIEIIEGFITAISPDSDMVSIQLKFSDEYKWTAEKLSDINNFGIRPVAKSHFQSTIDLLSERTSWPSLPGYNLLLEVYRAKLPEKVFTDRKLSLSQVILSKFRITMKVNNVLLRLL